MEKSNYTLIGSILKPHGLKGEILADVNEEMVDLIYDLDYLMIDVDGGLVPFFVAEDGVRMRNDTSVLIQFDDLDNADKVRHLVGCNIYIDNEELSGEEIATEDNQLLGFEVIDQTFGTVGTIIRINDYSGNLVITVQHPKAEVLIPLSDDIIVSIGEKEKTVILDCPDGLIDLYLG